MDDTDPSGETQEYVDSIIRDVRWLGFDWEGRLYYASDYYEQLYQYAIQLIQEGKAYVCNLSADEIREHRGTLTDPGKESPYRNRSVEENLDLFKRMRAGEFEDGAHVLRAKIDMASPTSPCGTRSFIESNGRITTEPGRNGASTRCMTSPTAFQTPSKKSPIRSARSNLKITAPCMIGFWMN